MRRLFFSLLATTCVVTTMGCWHIAGVCDCAEDPAFCRPSCGCGGVAVANASDDYAPLPTITNGSPRNLPAPSSNK